MPVDPLEQAERLKHLIVDPVVEALKAEFQTQMAPMADAIRSQGDRILGVETRVSKLETTQRKALIGWGVLSLGVTAAMSAGWNYIKSHIGFKT